MKKHLFTLILIVIIVFEFPLSAQKTKDALYLKNGSIIYGKLLEISENNYKIETSDKSLFIYPSAEVEKFQKENPRFEGRREKGPGFALEAGLLAGAQNNDFDAPFSFNFLVNYTTDTKNIFSIGSGAEFLGSTFAPLFFEYKRLFSERRVTPFLFLRGGGLVHIGDDSDSDEYPYQYNYSKDYKGGASFGFGTGISWAKEDIETYLSFSFRYAHTSYKQRDYNEVTYTYKNSYNRLEIKFGFKF
jgi:hypothetical protein